jgi:hypothetical protein
VDDEHAGALAGLGVIVGEVALEHGVALLVLHELVRDLGLGGGGEHREDRDCGELHGAHPRRSGKLSGCGR